MLVIRIGDGPHRGWSWPEVPSAELVRRLKDVAGKVEL